MNNFTRRNNWNEFQWEKEIRRDERRISRYYGELSSCLDLPGEEEMIFDQLSSQPDLVPTGGFASSLRDWFNSVHDDDDDEYDPGEISRRPDSPLVDEIDMLASEWNLIAAGKLRADLSAPGLGVCCAYGKLLGRTADFTDADDGIEPALKISLGKRIIHDINDVVGLLDAIAQYQISLQPELDFQTGQLGELRDKIFDRIEQLRQRKQSPER